MRLVAFSGRIDLRERTSRNPRLVEQPSRRRHRPAARSPARRPVGRTCCARWGLAQTDTFRLCKAGEPCILQVGATRIGVSRTVASADLRHPRPAAGVSPMAAPSAVGLADPPVTPTRRYRSPPPRDSRRQPEHRQDDGVQSAVRRPRQDLEFSRDDHRVADGGAEARSRARSRCSTCRASTT